MIEKSYMGITSRFACGTYKNHKFNLCLNNGKTSTAMP
jgi:hypothetical protein